MSNNNGGNVIYNYEYFSNNSPNFKVDVSVCPGCSIKLKPKNYKGVNENEVEGITGGKYPTCSWKTDLFVNWATQNAVNMMLNTAGNIMSIGLAGSSEQALAGGMGIANTIGSYIQHEMVPDSARGNVNCGDVVSGGRKNTFYYYQYSVTYQFAKIIDEYFTRFGYKTNLTNNDATFATMMENGFGIVTVMNPKVYEAMPEEYLNKTAYQVIEFLKTQEAICELDTLKIANVTQEGPTKTVTGGQFSNPLIKFGKSARLEMQDALGRADAIEAFVAEKAQ